MTVKRSEIVKMLAEKSGYYQKDIDAVLKCYDELFMELMDEVKDGEDVTVQVLQGVKISGHIVGERQRKDPRNQNDIIVGPTFKFATKFSEDIRKNAQNRYEQKKSEDS